MISDKPSRSETRAQAVTDILYREYPAAWSVLTMVERTKHLIRERKERRRFLFIRNRPNVFVLLVIRIRSVKSQADKNKKQKERKHECEEDIIVISERAYGKEVGRARERLSKGTGTCWSK